MNSIPLIECDFDLFLEWNKNLSKKDKELARKYNQDGYVVIDLELPSWFTDNLKQNILANTDFKKQENLYHYSDSPRIFEAWQHVDEVLGLAHHPKILKLLEKLYGMDPIPFQTINFIKGTNQPLHSDVIHFNTEPERWMVGVWVALEDITADSGPLCVVPGSHKFPTMLLHNIGLKASIYGDQEENYRIYETCIDKLVKDKGLETKCLIVQHGQAIIWAANLLHGGAPRLDPAKTRWSQATHYFFNGCRHYYCPLFSNVDEGQYAEKNLDKLICKRLEGAKL